MEELIENYGELIRTLSRLQNTNKELLLKSDIERLEKAKTILPKFAQGGAQWERSSHDAHGLNKHDVTASAFVRAFVDWSKKYPKGRIYSLGSKEGMQMMQELDALSDSAEAMIKHLP